MDESSDDSFDDLSAAKRVKHPNPPHITFSPPPCDPDAQSTSQQLIPSDDGPSTSRALFTSDDGPSTSQQLIASIDGNSASGVLIPSIDGPSTSGTQLTPINRISVQNQSESVRNVMNHQSDQYCTMASPNGN